MYVIITVSRDKLLKCKSNVTLTLNQKDHVCRQFGLCGCGIGLCGCVN